MVAELEINKADLRLPLPVTATVGSASLLGGVLRWPWSAAEPRFRRMHPAPHAAWLSANATTLQRWNCLGQEVPSLSTVTATMQELLAQVQDERVIPNVAASLEQIEATTKSFEAADGAASG